MNYSFGRWTNAVIGSVGKISVPSFEVHSDKAEEKSTVLGTHQNLADARDHAKILAAKNQGRYFVLCTKTQKVIFSVYQSPSNCSA
jgi:hypothetical protein